MSIKLLILTGACGVGKSTISKAWAQQENGAVVECDYFTEWMLGDQFESFSEEEASFVAEHAIASATLYLKNHISVAIENVWFPAEITKIRAQLKAVFPSIHVQCIRLYCSIEENHKRDQLRVPENQMKTRVDIVNAQLANSVWPSFVQHINSSNQTAEETLKQLNSLF